MKANPGSEYSAQDVEKVFPELVETGPDGIKGVYTAGLLGPLIEAIKQQHDEISELRDQISELTKPTGGRKRRKPQRRARLRALE